MYIFNCEKPLYPYFCRLCKGIHLSKRIPNRELRVKIAELIMPNESIWEDSSDI